MTPSRIPAVTLVVTASLFAFWAIVLFVNPGGSKLLEWIQLVVGTGLVAFGVQAYRKPSAQMARKVRYTLIGFAVFGAVVVIGLAADDNSSRTWARIGWAALLTGSIGSMIAWWSAPTSSV